MRRTSGVVVDTSYQHMPYQKSAAFLSIFTQFSRHPRVYPSVTAIEEDEVMCWKHVDGCISSEQWSGSCVEVVNRVFRGEKFCYRELGNVLARRRSTYLIYAIA
jgi:hypothetical protein